MPKLPFHVNLLPLSPSQRGPKTIRYPYIVSFCHPTPCSICILRHASWCQNTLLTRVHRRRSAAAECKALADAVLLKCSSSAKKPEVEISAGVPGRDDGNSSCRRAASGQSTEMLFVCRNEARELGLEGLCKDEDEGSEKTSEPLGVIPPGDPKDTSELSLPAEP